MKERPILFSGAMVEAILAGTKTMTRRIVKARHVDNIHSWNLHRMQDGYPDGVPRAVFEEGDEPIGIACPYGAPGDRLWVRERQRVQGIEVAGATRRVRVSYEADGAVSNWRPYPERLAKLTIGKCLSYGGPRETSRIDLEVTSVRVERLNDITGPDILAEGAVARPHRDDVLGMCPVSAFDGKAYVDLLSLWAAGWDSINGERAPWASNPWVWVVSFRRVRP